MANTRQQTHRICNLVPSRDTQRDWRMEHALEASSVQAPASLPSSVDLRAPWWDIGDQERTGSCVGWASTDGLARYHMVKEGTIAQPGLLSTRYTRMASKETDKIRAMPETFIEEAGTTLKAALDVLRKYGAVPEAMLPFHVETNMYLDSEEAFYATAANRRIASYFNMRKDFNAWRKWLATQGPIMAGLGVDVTWDNATSTQGKLDVHHADTVRGGHAVCVVGYTADDRFIIRNSWNTTWGDQGFAYASEAYIAAGFFDESYGVTV